MKRYERICKMIAVLPAVLLSGCTAAVIGVGEQAYNHVRGDLLGIVAEPLEQVYSASVEALKQLDGYEISKQEINIIEGNVTAYDPTARKVVIDLSKTEHDQTRIQIRIGLFGDKLESTYLYDRIQESLKKSRQSKVMVRGVP